MLQSVIPHKLQDNGGRERPLLQKEPGDRIPSRDILGTCRERASEQRKGRRQKYSVYSLHIEQTE